ncbi:MAG: amidohydrolase family protein [Acidobacteriota bacterium]
MPKPERPPRVAPPREAAALTAATALIALLAAGPAHAEKPRAQAGPAESEAAVHAFVGAQILPISGPPIDRGVLVIRGSLIAAVGAADEVEIPSDAVRHELTADTVIMSGLVDTHSHIGGPFAADRSAPIQPAVRSLDGIDARSPGFQRARAGGLTTLNLMSGSGHLMSGQTVYVKLREAATIDDILIRREDAPGGGIAGGMKMANGTNSRRDPPFPGTRAKSAALVREQFIKAEEYRRKVERAAGDAEKRPDRDLAMEALGEILDGSRTVHHHTHRHDDILTVLRLREEFGDFDVVLHHVSDAWKVADEIAAAGVGSSVIVIDSPGGKLEAMHASLETGGVLERAGALVAFHTDDWITDSRLFLRSAALAVRGGMSREGALRAMTLSGAEMLRLDDRIGSLEAGKDADFIILSGDPLSVYTRVEQTYVEGEKLFDLEDDKDRLIASGGWGAGSERDAHVACVGLHLHEEHDR